MQLHPITALVPGHAYLLEVVQKVNRGVGIQIISYHAQSKFEKNYLKLKVYLKLLNQMTFHPLYVHLASADTSFSHTQVTYCMSDPSTAQYSQV